MFLNKGTFIIGINETDTRYISNDIENVIESKVNKKQEEVKSIEYILKISAKTEISLRDEIRKYYDRISEASDEGFLDVLYAANRKKLDFEYRLTVVGNSKQDMVNHLEKYLIEGYSIGVWTNLEEKPVKKDRKVVFMFTGQGSQYVNMGRTLFETNMVFHNAMIECDEMFEPYTLKSLIKLIYSEKADENVIAKTIYAQPLIFSIEYALAKMWEDFGVKPEVVIGHSIGEYAAAVVAGSMTLMAAVKLVAVRGRLMNSAPGYGTMGTIFASEEVINNLIAEYQETVSIAALNSKETCVISGHVEDVRAILSKAQEQGIRIRELKVSHGFHSVLMQPILEEFDNVAQNVYMKTPSIKFLSSLYAKEITTEDVFDHSYWTNHITQKVDFYHTITSLGAPEDYIFVEIGANTVLSAICKIIFGSDATVVGSLSIKKDTAKQMAETIATLYANGIDVDWEKVVFHGTRTGHHLDIIEKTMDEESSQNFFNNLKNMSKEDREEALMEEMKKRCCEIMGFENVDLFDVDKAFREQGADSLILLSIRTVINKLLYIELDISVLYNYSTLRLLTEYLIQTQFHQEILEEGNLEQQEDMLLKELEQLID